MTDTADHRQPHARSRPPRRRARQPIKRRRTVRFTAPSASRARARTHVNQATWDFPISTQQVLAEASAKAYPPDLAAASYPSHGPATPRQRGPTR